MNQIETSNYRKPLLYALGLHGLLIFILIIHFNFLPKHNPVTQNSPIIINAVAVSASQLNNPVTPQPVAQPVKTISPIIPPPPTQAVQTPPALAQSKSAEIAQKMEQQQADQQKSEQQQAAQPTLQKAQALKEAQQKAERLLEAQMAEEKLAQQKAEAVAREKAQKEQAEKAKRAAAAKAQKLKIEKEQKLLAQQAIQQALQAQEKSAEQIKQQRTRAQQLQTAKQAAQQSLQQQLSVASANAKNAPAALSKAEQGQVDKYSALIISAIGQQWIIPDSAQKNLQGKLQVKVAPGGMVLSVAITQSSGDAAFDRSARAAVFKASPLPVPKEGNVFSEFRSLNLTFRPEGMASA